MKIALPKDGEMLSQHFGRSRSFAVASLEDNKVIDLKEISAESLQHNHGGLSNLLINEGVSVVIAGGMGEGAFNALKESGLEVIRGVSGKIDEVLGKYLEGSLRDSEVSCGHHGEHEHHHI